MFQNVGNYFTIQHGLISQTTVIFKSFTVCENGINLLKTKRNLLYTGISPYRAVNTSHHGYKNQSVVPGLASDPPHHRENSGGRGGMENPNQSYRKLPLLLKSNHLMFTRARARTHTHTSCSLPWYFRSDPLDNAFATNVSYSVGHLTSIL
jgi:hypothetical protein